MLRLLKVSPARFDPILRLDANLRLRAPRNIDFNPTKEQPYVKR